METAMSNRTVTVLGALSAIAIASVAWAEDPIPESGDSLSVFKEMGEWTIYADATRGSCLAERVDSEGNAMQMGLTKDGSAAYVGVFTLAEVDFRRNDPIAIAVDGKIFEGKSHGVRSKKLVGGQHGGYIITNNPELVDAIANGEKLIAFPEKVGVFEVDLTGTKVAIDEIRTCTAGLAG
jgi:hypothetical protein